MVRRSALAGQRRLAGAQACWRQEADAGLDFNIHYHPGKTEGPTRCS